MATTVPSYSPETARVAAELTLQAFESEFPTTKRVLGAITNPDFKLDPKARTASEIAWHLVTSEVSFLEAIAARKFAMEEKYKEDRPKTVAEMIAWYEKRFPEAIAQMRRMTPEQLLTPVDFYGVLNWPVFRYLDIALRHSVHHRAFIAASLRPMGSRVPSIYGGSADDPGR